VVYNVNALHLHRLSGTISENWDAEEKERAAAQNRDPLDEPYYPFYEQILRYWLTMFTAIDLLSIIPTYVTLAVGSSEASALEALRVLRLLRVLRVMKISVRGRMIIELLSRTMTASQEAFMILLFYLGLMVIFFASAVYAVEVGDYEVTGEYRNGTYLRPDGFGGKEPTPFDSIPTTIYYMIVTFTTVGYGKKEPSSSLA